MYVVCCGCVLCVVCCVLGNFGVGEILVVEVRVVKKMDGGV